MTRQRGLTLMELMIALVILAILVGIAVPTYNEQIRKTRRAEAMIALTEIANLQEQFYADNFRYTSTLALLPYPSTSDGGQGYYSLSVPSVTTSPPGFTVQAQALTSKSQKDDTNCRTLTLTNTGVRASKDSGGNTSTGCWVTGE